MTEGGSETSEVAGRRFRARSDAQRQSDEYRSNVRLAPEHREIKDLDGYLEQATFTQEQEAYSRAKRLDRLGIKRKGPNQPL